MCVCVCLALLTVFCLFNGFVLHSASASTSTRAQVSTATAIELSHKRVKWAGIAILLALPLSYHISLAAPCQAFAICILNCQSIHGIDSLRVSLVPRDQALVVPTYCVIANLRNLFWWRFKAHCYDTKHATVYFELFTNIYYQNASEHATVSFWFQAVLQA